MFRKMALCAVRNKILRQSIISPMRHVCLFCNEPHKTPYTFQISLFRKLSNAVPDSIQREEELELPEDIKRKIIFNSLTHKFGFLTRKKIERREKLHKKRMEAAMVYSPVSLKYLNNDDSFEYPSSDAGDDSPNDNKESDSYILNLPYKKSVKDDIFINKNNSEVVNDDYDIINNNSKVVNENVDYQDLITDYPSKYIGKWMNDYEKYSEEEPEGTELSFWRDDYGTPDSSVPVSRVPCGGCGAHLHCQDHSIPGYLPSEIFKNCDEKDLREIVCQRCHFLKNYNTALSVTVNSEDYPQIISKIRDKKALVVLIADMTDLPCSIWPGILDIIGPRQPLFLVGNKVDLLPGDRKGWLREAQSYLRSCFPKNAVVHFTSLISAKTGFGVEELINKLHNFWQYKGDVYLVGCTNVGKSTLFNALLQSDYCKVKAVDLLQRATTAPWPGTTLNLLKFPILRPDGWRLYMRTQRLIQNRKSLAAERKLKNHQKVLNKTEFPQLIGHIGRTFSRKKPEQEFKSIDNFSTGKPERLGLDPNDPDFAKSKWVFDTPGVLTKEQCLDLLTTDEVYLTVPKDVIIPRTYIMKVGWSLFVAGLARIDYLSGEQDIKVTIFSANTLPVTILYQEHAEEVYKELLGSEALQVPQGPEKRLKAWPGLERAKEINLIGVDGEESCADVSLSSAGWASITPYEKEIVKLSFWTPEGRGVHVRAPLLPKAVSLRGKKLNKIPVYGRTRPSLAGYKEY